MGLQIVPPEWIISFLKSLKLSARATSNALQTVIIIGLVMVYVNQIEMKETAQAAERNIDTLKRIFDRHLYEYQVFQGENLRAHQDLYKKTYDLESKQISLEADVSGLYSKQIDNFIKLYQLKREMDRQKTQ